MMATSSIELKQCLQYTYLAMMTTSSTELKQCLQYSYLIMMTTSSSKLKQCLQYSYLDDGNLQHWAKAMPAILLLSNDDNLQHWAKAMPTILLLNNDDNLQHWAQAMPTSWWLILWCSISMSSNVWKDLYAHQNFSLVFYILFMYDYCLWLVLGGGTKELIFFFLTCIMTLELHRFWLLCSIKLIYSSKERSLCVLTFDMKMLPVYNHTQVTIARVWRPQNCWCLKLLQL